MSPTARTLVCLRRAGFLAAVVESWIPHANLRRDLFGFADVLAVHPRDRLFLLVQVTTADHLANRLAKVQRVPELPAILAAGVKVNIHGWARRGGRWHVRVVDVVQADLPPLIVANLPRRRGRKSQQRTLWPI